MKNNAAELGEFIPEVCEILTELSYEAKQANFAKMLHRSRNWANEQCNYRMWTGMNIWQFAKVCKTYNLDANELLGIKVKE